MGMALLDEFGIGDAQAREESWRHSRTALRALSQNDFATADAHAMLSAALLTRVDWPQRASGGSFSSMAPLQRSIRAGPGSPASRFNTPALPRH